MSPATTAPAQPKPESTVMSGVVLVTGGLGYLGSQLLRSAPEWLEGRTIRVLDNLATRGERALVDLPPGCRYEFLEGDVLDAGVVRYALRDVDTVIHLAGVVRTPMSFEHPTWMRQVNTWGTATLTEAAVTAGVKRFVYTSSTAVYGPGGPFDETAQPRPLGPYATSKLAAEESVLVAGERANPVVLRLGMLYGHAPCARYDGFVNRLLFQAGTGRAMTIYGSGDQRRPIVHVRDAASAIWHAASDTPLADNVFNVVESNASVLDVVAVLKGVRPELNERFAEQDVLSHLSFLVAGERLRKSGWSPELRLAEAAEAELARFAGFGSRSSGSDEVLSRSD